jgi:hypothetical protein
MRYSVLNPVNVFAVLLLTAVLASCASSGQQAAESQEAKQLLQGVWSDAETESVVFKMEGDSVYYPDSISMTAYFKVVGDTLYIGSTGHYHIEKQSEHLLWFTAQDGSLVKLVKGEKPEAIAAVFEEPQIQQLKDVAKRDTVVYYEANKYHVYIAINPTKYKVSHTAVNEDGLSVENVYYDNIIHLSIFQGATQLFSRDFHKQFFERQLPAGIVPQSILNNMEYTRTDAAGFHLNASLCIPGAASCYLVEVVVSFDGSITSKLTEY